MQDYSCLSIFG